MGRWGLLAVLALAACATLPDPVGPGATPGRVESLYAHLRYDEAAMDDLRAACAPDGGAPLLHKQAAKALARLTAAAKAAGHDLRAESCFRPIRRQVDLYFGRIASGAMTPEDRARLSAPPGFSEHATGYAIDFCNGADRKSCEDLDAKFAESGPGKWLHAYGPVFGFERSFPDAPKQCFKRSDGKKQCVSPEPWHWRYVGTVEAKAVFNMARDKYPAEPRVAE
jgi:D-alanyl-D-alanine carboxypeptidase